MTDEERIDWIEIDVDRFDDIRGILNNEDAETVREAIDILAERQKVVG